MWDKTQIRQIAQTKKFAVVVASALSLAGGFTAGHLLTKKQLETKYAELSDREIEQAKVFYERKNKKGEFADPVALAERYVDGEYEVYDENEETDSDIPVAEVIEHVKKLKYHSSAIETNPELKEQAEVRESITKNIFEGRSPIEEDDEEEIDIELQTATKEAGRPYIIHHDDFFENETDYAQVSFTYFEEDEVLVDEQDQPVREINRVIGEENIRFGHGSKDKNIVYIRNDKLEIDFEVTRSLGSYTEEVLGFIEHSDKPRPRKFRNYD